MRLLEGHKHAVRAVASAPGAVPLVASAGDDLAVRLWDPLGGKEIATLQGRGGILSLAFSPDGVWLAAGTRSGFVSVYDVARQSRESDAGLCLGPVIDMAYTPDGRTILFALRSQEYARESGQLLCWDQVPPHSPVQLGWTGEVESVAIAPNRDLFAVAGQHRGLEFWEVGRAQEEPLLWMPARVRAMNFSPDGKRLAVGTGRVIALIDADKRQLIVTLRGHRSDVRALAFSPNGSQLLSGSADRSVRLWDVNTGYQIESWDWQIGPVNAVCWSVDGMTAAAVGDRPTVIVWDMDG